tara:strand:- start:133 stop:726 length:594 start_codon:yes stop_codon:yes gene_type:complete
MINNLSDDIIYFILKKLHKFKYLYILKKVNKYFSIQSKNILNFHYYNMNNYLNYNNNYIYELVSNKLFFSKILNIKKINNSYYNSIKNLNISDFIKLCLIFNEYNDRIQTKHIRIINLKELLLFLEHSKKDAYFFPFMIMLLNNHFTIFVEYENEKKNYRLKLKYKNNDISVFKSISEENLFHLFHLSKKQILDIYL